MAKDIISVEYEIPGHSEFQVNYISDASLLDADLIVFQPPSFPSDSGKASYNESYSEQLKDATQHWRKEINTALEYGKTVFLIVTKYEMAQVYTGQKEFKGARTINYVTNIGNYDFVSHLLPPLVAKGGATILFKNHPALVAFWAEFSGNLKFESYFDGKLATPVFVTKTGEKPIGGIVKVGKGHLVLLPVIEYDEDLFVTKKAGKSGEYVWTKAALSFGSRLVSALSAVDKTLRKDSQRTTPPGWVEEKSFELAAERAVTKQLMKARADIETLVSKQHELEAELNRHRELKDLLFETGKPLENAVIEALRILGYTAENYDDGTLELDQVIVSPEGERFIGECEGKDTSAINVDKFRQLADNIQADLEREDVDKPATGILFGNGYRLTLPKDRPEQFTAKCLESAKRGTILVRTPDLYLVSRHVKQHDDKAFAAACRKAIVSSAGGIVNFSPIPKV